MHGLWFASIDRKDKLHLVLILHPLKLEKTIPEVPGIQDSGSVLCRFLPGNSSVRIKKPQLVGTQSGPKEEVETNSPEDDDDLVTRCSCQQAGPKPLTRWWGGSFVAVCPGDYLESSNSKLTWHRKLVHQCTSLKSSLWVGFIATWL